MMHTLWKYSYYGYLVIVAILILEGISRLSSNTKWAVILFAMAGLVLVKFFITRRFRKKLEERHQQR